MKRNLSIPIISILVTFCLITLPIGNVVSTVSGSVGSNFLDEDMESCYVSTDDAEFTMGTARASAAVGVWNCTWDELFGWQYVYKIGGMGVSTGDRIRSATIEVEAEVNDNIAIQIQNMSSDTWSAPSSNTGTAEMVDVSMLVIDVLLAAAPAGIGLTWTAASAVLSALRSDSGETTYSTNYGKMVWTWDLWQHQVCQQTLLVAYVQPNCTESCTIEYTLFGPNFGTLYPGIFEFTMSAPSYSGSEIRSMSIEERESVGITTIQRDDLLYRASELNLSPEVVINFLSTDSEEFYIANSTPTCRIIKPTYSSENPSPIMNETMNNSVNNDACSVNDYSQQMIVDVRLSRCTEAIECYELTRW